MLKVMLVVALELRGLRMTIYGRYNQHQLSLLSAMGGNAFSNYNDVYAYWCPDCDYKMKDST